MCIYLLTCYITYILLYFNFFIFLCYLFALNKINRAPPSWGPHRTFLLVVMDSALDPCAAPIVSRPNKAFKLFRRHSYDIFKAIVDPSPLSWSLFSQNIIDRYTLDKVTAIGVPKYNQVSAILDGVLACIDAYPEALDKFLDVLREHPPADRVAERIKQLFVGK